MEKSSQRERYTSNPLYSNITSLLSDPPEITPEVIVDLKRSLQELSTFSNVINRTTHRDVQPGTQRTPYVVKVDLSEEEMFIYNSFLEIVKKQYLINHPNASYVHPFALIVRERQAASCLPAVSDYVKDLSQNPHTELGEEISDNEIMDDTDLNSFSLNTDDLSELIQTVNQDSKFDQFKLSLDEVFQQTPNSKVLVFAFFKRTLKYLQTELLSSGIIPDDNIFMINGDVPQELRRKTIEKFRIANKGAVLLLSEVGAEGHDFQFCDVLMNYDLPWNPMKVEQRIGRIDRYGQKAEKIRIYSFTLNNTIEETILSRLYERIGIFESSIGDLEPILGESIKELEKIVFQQNLTLEQREVQQNQILESIEYKRLQADQFRQEQQRLMGQGEIFSELFDETLNNGKYISENEIIV